MAGIWQCKAGIWGQYRHDTVSKGGRLGALIMAMQAERPTLAGWL